MLDDNAFKYLKPTDEQLEHMDIMRHAFAKLTKEVELALPVGADKDHVIRLIRDSAMWANVALTRYDDGSPRK